MIGHLEQWWSVVGLLGTTVNNGWSFRAVVISDWLLRTTVICDWLMEMMVIGHWEQR